MDKRNKQIEKKGENGSYGFLSIFIACEVAIFLLLFAFAFSPYFELVLADVGQDNVTVTTLLNIGNSFPEVINISINNLNSIDLTPNSTTPVSVVAVIRDFNGENDIDSVTSEFFDNSVSFYGDSDDNNFHYSNSSCTIDTSYGDSTEVNATCIFPLEYYANNATWNATIFVNDTLSSSTTSSEISTVNTLLALGLPDSIDFGEVNATSVSGQRHANVTNLGNVIMNLSLSGYGAFVGDGNAMNCTLGATQNISIEYEKYNLTASSLGAMDLASFEGNYSNLTSAVVVNEFNLGQRLNDTASHTDDTNSTYWRIYVPLGVAGSCSGNIVFGAVQSPAG